MDDMPMQPMQQMDPSQMPMQQRSGLFAKKAPTLESPDYTEEIMRRLRTLEERYSSMDRKNSILEQNMLSNDRRLSSELKNINSEILDLKTAVEDIKDKIMLMADEVKQTAKVEDVEIIRKYTDYLDPLKFISQEEMEKVVREIVEDRVADLQQHVAQSIIQRIAKQVGEEKEAQDAK
jgi:hypothetical protein